MAIVEYTLDEHVAIVTLNSGENRFNPEFLNAFLEVLDLLENDTDARTLVVTSSHENIFSNGIDLDWLIPVLGKGDTDTAKDFFYLMNRLFTRTITYPMVTVAAINGHAFGGGAIYSCAYDFRFMRTGRGFFCLPEVDIGIPFLPGMNALLKKAIPLQKLVEMQYTGKRMTAEECEAHHLIVKGYPIEDLMRETLVFAKTLKKDRAVVHELKKRLHGDIVHAMEVDDVPYIESGKYNIEMT
jgi:Delta3-Delta2-enoyl-CoA isomerase